MANDSVKLSKNLLRMKVSAAANAKERETLAATCVSHDRKLAVQHRDEFHSKNER